MSEDKKEKQNSFGNNVFHNTIGGTELPAICVDCLKTTTVPLGHTFRGTSPVLSKGNIALCPHCGSIAQILDGTYEFANDVVEELSKAKFRRQQLRRFDLKRRKSKSIDELARQSNSIDPAFTKLTLSAKKQSDPQAALKTIVAIGKCILATSVTAASLAGGIIAADEISDRFQKKELFENHEPSSNDIEEQFENKPTNKRQNNQSPGKLWRKKITEI